MNIDYEKKYLKYKNKYLKLKNQNGGRVKSNKRGNYQNVIVAAHLNNILRYANRFFIPSNAGLFESQLYFSNRRKHLGITINLLNKLKLEALRRHLDPSYHSNLLIINNLIRSVNTYFKCFLNKFSKRQILTLFRSYGIYNINDIPLNRLQLLSQLVGNGFNDWSCMLNSNNNLYVFPDGSISPSLTISPFSPLTPISLLSTMS